MSRRQAHEFTEGYNAYQDGRTEYSNPYGSGTTAAHNWLHGWNTAMEEMLAEDSRDEDQEIDDSWNGY